MRKWEGIGTGRPGAPDPAGPGRKTEMTEDISLGKRETDGERKEQPAEMTEDISLGKREMRRELKERLAEMTEEEIRRSSEGITRAVLSSAVYRRARTLFVYISVGKEPDTREIIQRALAEGKEVYVPRCGRPPRMEAVRITGFADLRPGRMGIPEPAEGESTDRADLAIVPCVSVSRDGRRLGHGGGYYDAFLRGKNMETLCLCHEGMMREEIPVSGEDVRVDRIATAEGVKKCLTGGLPG